MPYRRNPDETYTRWTYRRNANGTYSRVSDRKPDEGMGGFGILLILGAVAAIIGGIIALVRAIGHHSTGALQAVIIAAITLGVIGVLVLIGYIARERR